MNYPIEYSPVARHTAVSLWLTMRQPHSLWEALLPRAGGAEDFQSNER